VNGNAAARSGEWAQHFSNAFCSVIDLELDMFSFAALTDKFLIELST